MPGGLDYHLEVGLQDGVADTAALVEGVEHGDTVGAADHRLPVQGE
jgi:hypothetical protein